MADNRLDGVLQHIHKLVAAEHGGAPADGELLERFVRRRDEAAFAALVQRHGPMVLGVCRRVLKDSHDAEDACQAAFLILARRAASIRKRASVGSWLHGVAYRAAANLRRQVARRRGREVPVVDVAQPAPAELTWCEVRTVLDEELRRLPERFRAPLLLCCLEGRTRDEAAQELGWNLGTLRGRLERGRELLRARLRRRGVGLSAALLAALLTGRAASAAVPAALVVSIIKAAAASAAGRAAPAGVVSAQAAAVAEGVVRTMLMTRLKIITGVLLALGLVGLGAGLLTSGALSARPPGDQAAAEPPGPRDADAPPAADDKEQPAGRQLARNEAESRDNLKQLAIAIHNYNDVYGHLPAPAIYAGEQPGAGGAQGGPGGGRGGMIPGRGGRPGAGSMGPGGGPGLPPGAGPPTSGGRPGASGGGGWPGGPGGRAGAGSPGGPPSEAGWAPGGPGGGGGGAGATATPGGGDKPAGGAGTGGPGLPGTEAGAARRGGKALLSWRVALLPFLGEANLYKQFRLDEPWDGPHNKKLLAKMPKVYAPPGVKTREPYTTFYQVFVGGGAIFEKHQVARLPASIPDGTSNTILIAEAGAAVPWTKPEDMHFAPDEPLPELGGMYPKIFNVVFADGAAAALLKQAGPDQLRGAITCAGGEVVDWDKIKAPASPRAAALREQNGRLKEELAKERARLDELRRKRRVLAEEDADSERLRKENEQLEKMIRDTRDQAERLRQEIERLKQAPGKRPGDRKP
jgi:RNA polymerase sigma factor (sigma-70 family)